MMGSKKVAMKRIESAAARQLAYAKRKDGIVKKTRELSVLCGVDVALIMFSPTGALTTFATNGRGVEDIFLRFVDRPDELRGGPINNEQLLCERLKQLKYEGEMLEKIAIIEGLEKNLDKLNGRRLESEEKLRYYQPNLAMINSALEAGVYHRFLSTAIQRLQLSKAKLLGNQQRMTDEHIQASTGSLMDDATSVIHQNRMRISSITIENQIGQSQSMGPHLSLSFIEAHRHWDNNYMSS